MLKKQNCNSFFKFVFIYTMQLTQYFFPSSSFPPPFLCQLLSNFPGKDEILSSLLFIKSFFFFFPVWQRQSYVCVCVCVYRCVCDLFPSTLNNEQFPLCSSLRPLHQNLLLNPRSCGTLQKRFFMLKRRFVSPSFQHFYPLPRPLTPFL